MTLVMSILSLVVCVRARVVRMCLWCWAALVCWFLTSVVACRSVVALAAATGLLGGRWAVADGRVVR